MLIVSVVLCVLLWSVSLFIVSKLLPGFRIKSFGTAIWVSLVLGAVTLAAVFVLVPLFIPFVMVMFFPALVLPQFVLQAIGWVLGLGIQAALLQVTDWLIEDFEIDNWATAWVAAFLMNTISSVLAFFIS